MANLSINKRLAYYFFYAIKFAITQQKSSSLLVSLSFIVSKFILRTQLPARNTRLILAYANPGDAPLAIANEQKETSLLTPDKTNKFL